ncbi:MAG TPA: NAD(P)/FAD-dependent oxidoreductase, partial [Chloroflexota bacterium]|nr:NAD(P)/FAD-dependent oxidoreductase [Chloroflexota bacterium]
MADYDLAVVGAGSAGYHAARVASDQGKSVALIEGGERFGGLCILRGCMPTKAMLRSAEIAQLVRESAELGIETSEPVINWSRIVQRTADLVTKFADYRHDSARGLDRVDIIRDWAAFDSPESLRLSNRTLTADRFVIATGSVPRTPGTESDKHPPGLEETGYLTSDDVPLLPELPESIIVFGGGAIALEFAQLFCRLGVEVTVIQRSPLILSNMDAD